MEEKKLTGLDGKNLTSKEFPPVSDETVRSHIKVPGNKILVRVMRRKVSTILTVDKDAFEFEEYFPVLAIGDSVRGIELNDYVALKEGKHLITKLFGHEFMVVDTYMVEFIVSKDYALLSHKYKDSFDIAETAAKLAEESGLKHKVAKGKGEQEMSPAIMGSWASKSKIN